MGRRTGKTTTMVIHILWYAFTHKDSRQVIATPYDSQIRMIFDMIQAFISNSPELENSIANMTKNPHEIKLKNGATIKGFTAGTRSGAEGGSLRGQAADWLYMDEIDYMTDGDFETIYAIALADPKRIGVWISSTPTGRRGVFWKSCVGIMPGWTEFYYPSMSNPNWDAQMEAELRATFSEVGYQHEVLAEFGEETIGVFKKEFIDRARYKYEYLNAPMHRARRVIGTDWDKYGDATQIVVMEYDELAENFSGDRGMFKVINRVEIPKGKFTLDNAVNKIIELNAIYDPDAIYVDRGYGEHQVETLHKYGMNHPETELHTKVVGIPFSGAKAITDPWTKVTENKPIKAFMVDQLTILFERDRMIINDSDEMIIRQFENYRVVKITDRGAPKYTSEDEHTIDCIMLAILGFMEKFPGITATIAEYKPATRLLHIQTKAKNALQDAISKGEGDVFNRNKDYLEWDEPGSAPLKRVDLGSKPKDRDTRTRAFGWSTRGSNISKEHKRSSW